MNARPRAPFVRPAMVAAACAALWIAGTGIPAPAQTPATGPDGSVDSSQEIRSEIDSILAQPEFRRLRLKQPTVETPETEWTPPQWIRDFFEWLSDFFGFQKSFGGIGIVLQSLAWLVVGLICGLIVYLLVKAVRQYQRRLEQAESASRTFAEGEADLPPGDLPADEYVRRAMELAARGMYREAIGQLLLGAMSYAERAGLIRFRRGLTYRDYLRALRSRTDPHQAFRTLVATYEPICFGRQPAHPEQYEESLHCYRSAFEVQP
jgi:tetratricopeptide (TPR) repeat protein